MPMKSQAQRKWMHANKPKMAERWEKETKKGTKLPKKKGLKTIKRQMVHTMRKPLKQKMNTDAKKN